MTDPIFLPDVPADQVLAALRRAPGNELASGKFTSPDSSAALAANAFGWFLPRPSALPPLPGVPMGQPQSLAIETQMRFPWRGGEHPWLDAAIETPTTLVGIESKRYEPFRPRKNSAFSDAYFRPVWGQGMQRWTDLRDALHSQTLTYRHLDAVQLVKHALGLATQIEKQGKGAVLVYLHAAPSHWASSGKPLDSAAILRHRSEIDDFATRIKGARVTFAALAWQNLIGQWEANPDLAPHAAQLQKAFASL